MAALRKILVFLVVLLAFAITATLAYLNPGEISVNLAFIELQGIPTYIALAVTFALGCLFGAACVASAMFRSANQRRRLRRELRAAESEVSSLRSLPLNDAN